MLVANTNFVHRANPDGTIDSICRICCATVYTAMWEAELDLAEQRHSCEAMQMQLQAPPTRLAG